MELLAPAGGMSQLEAALRYGADAVYGGMKSYGLRAFAGNFDIKALAQAVESCHAKGKRFYVTMNMLPYDSDMAGFEAATKEAARVGVDAAIVSDLGAMLLLSERVPELALHVSTQANVLNTPTARHLYDTVKAKRIILARELSLDAIRNMRAQLPADLELEAFVHGAMCVSYSGRCLLSTALTGRGANRGECAQPCRWRYGVVEEKRPGEVLPVGEDERGTYLFSSYDLRMLEHLDELRRAGLSSLKIEGRMKTAYYVAGVTYCYRAALDLLEKGGEAAYRAALPALGKELDKVSHRESNTGFYYGAPIPAAGADGFSQTREYVAQVIETLPSAGEARITVKNRFFVGDTLELLSPDGVKPFVVTQIRSADTGEMVDTVYVAGTEALVALPFPAEQGDIITGPNRNHIKADRAEKNA